MRRSRDEVDELVRLHRMGNALLAAKLVSERAKKDLAGWLNQINADKASALEGSVRLGGVDGKA